MRRFPYIGNAGAQGGGLAVPMQSETVAYLSRFTSPVSATYRNALNTAIFRWKQAGLYSLIGDLWLFFADTAADARRNLVSAARDATLISSGPSFTANKGFSGFNGTLGVACPFNSAAYTTGTPAFFGGIINDALGNGVLVGDAANRTGAISVQSSLWGVGPGFYNSGAGISGGSTATGLIGSSGIDLVTASGVIGSTSSPDTLISAANFQASGIVRAVTYGFLATAATTAQTRKFLAILQAFIEEMGALD